MINKLTQSISSLSHAISGLANKEKQFNGHKSHIEFTILQDLIKEIGKNIMSAISAFAEKQNVRNDKIDKAIDSLSGDIKSLNDTIEKFQNSVGTVTPEDQALLDQLETRGDAIESKLEALDAVTADKPVVPNV